MADGSRRIGLLPALLACVLTACGGGGDASGPPPLPAPPSPSAGTLGDGRLADLIEWARAAQDVPAMGVIIIRGGQVEERAVVGLRSADGGPAATVEDRWHMGSITKSMTSTLAASMVEDGLISWDTTPLDVWPELANDIHADFRNATLRQFLSHTSGMKRDDDWSGAADSASGTADAEAARVGEAPAVPGAGILQRHVVVFEHGLRGGGRHAGDPRQHRMGDAAHDSSVRAAGHDAQRLRCAGNARRSSISRSGTGAAAADSIPCRSERALTTGSPWGPPARCTPRWMISRTTCRHISTARAGCRDCCTTESFDMLHTPVASDYALGWWWPARYRRSGAAASIHNGSNLRWFAVTWFSPQKNAGLLIVLNGGGERGFAAMSALDTLLRAENRGEPVRSQASGRLK